MPEIEPTNLWTALGGLALAVAYYFWPRLKGWAGGLFSGGSSSASPRIEAAEHLVAAEKIAADMKCDKAVECIRHAAQALWEVPAK